MTTINLHQDLNEIKSQNKSNKIVDKGFYFSISILAVTLLVLGGMKFFNVRLTNEMAVADAQIKEVKDGFARDRVNSAVDFQQRLDVIDKNMKSQSDANAVLQEAAKAVISGARIISYENENKGLTIQMSTDDFFTVAKQVLSFKKAGSFSDVSVSKIQRGEDEITFNLSMRVLL